MNDTFAKKCPYTCTKIFQNNYFESLLQTQVSGISLPYLQEVIPPFKTTKQNPEENHRKIFYDLRKRESGMLGSHPNGCRLRCIRARIYFVCEKRWGKYSFCDHLGHVRNLFIPTWQTYSHCFVKESHTGGTVYSQRIFELRLD